MPGKLTLKQDLNNCMKICAISDTHNQHRSIKLPEADILIHAGDFTNRGKIEECASFLNWFGEQTQYKARICIAGNHDFLSQKDPNLFKSLIPSNVTYLRDSGIEIEGLKIWGTPWQPFFYDWAWNGLEKRENVGLAYEGGPGNGSEADKDHPWLKDVYAQIPDDTNVLICHGPPRLGTLDVVHMHRKLGSVDLYNRIKELGDLKAGVYGHMHSGYGIHEFMLAQHCNAALCDEFNKLVKEPIVVEIE